MDTDSWADGSGHWLRVHASVPSRPGVEVRYARLLVHRDGPDREPELEAALYSSAFIELVLTELPRREPEGGVVEL